MNSEEHSELIELRRLHAIMREGEGEEIGGGARARRALKNPLNPKTKKFRENHTSE